jgi:GST-like protein
MIDLYYWPTPNGHKITMFLEEAGLDYTIHPVNISAGDQFKPEFLAFSPNNRMPAVIDRDPADSGEAVTVFESGAIPLYLAEKTGRFRPPTCVAEDSDRDGCSGRWAGSGRWRAEHISGSTHHEKIAHAIDRYVHETNRLYGVMDRRLAGRRLRAGDEYSIADMAPYPWVVPWKRQQQNLDDFVNLRRWFDCIHDRPGTRRAYAKGEPFSAQPAVTEEGKKLLFGQTAASFVKA